MKCAAVIFALLCGTLQASEKRPNILLILADNWRYPNAGILGDPMAKTPAFDRVASEGVLFTHTFNPVPSCSPTRSCLLTGRIAHQLGERASLWSGFPKDTPVVTQLLRNAGYDIGYSGKPWAPGNHEVSGWKENPVGPRYSNFANFHAKRDGSKPFFFWIGNTDTATKNAKTPYLLDANARLDSRNLKIPPELPDCPETRDDLMNYYGGVMKLDEEAAQALQLLEKASELEDTVVIYTSDNGWQMPRGLANCYDSGSRVPLAIRWGKKLKAGRRVEDFVNVADLGPTFLELAQIDVPEEMSMHGIKNLMFARPDPFERDAVFIERERHANVRRENQSYPVRAVRTRDFLYVRNLRPDRWPAGDPDVLFLAGRPYGDVDTTLAKDFLLRHQDDPAYSKFFSIIFAKRPPEELYDIRNDPHQIVNVVDKREYSDVLQTHRNRLDDWMRRTGDPRVDSSNDDWDKFPYYGKPIRRE